MPKVPAKQLVIGTPVAIGAANAQGSSNASVLSDHVHSHGNQAAGAALHAAATTSIAGFMASTDKSALDALSDKTFVQSSTVVFFRPVIRLNYESTPTTMVADTVYATYIGSAVKAMTGVFVKWYAPTDSTGTDNGCQVGFGTGSAPNTTGFSAITPVAVGAVKTPLTAGVKQSVASLSGAIPAGAHIWAFVRSNMSGVQLSMCHQFGDTLGTVVSKAAIGTIVVGTPFTCDTYGLSPDFTLQVQ